MPLLLDLCNEIACGENPALILPLLSTESLGESWLHRRALALHFSLAEAYRVTHLTKALHRLVDISYHSCR